MKLCDDHLLKLHKEIDASPMAGYKAETFEEALQRVAFGGFDPVVYAYNSIMANGVDFLKVSDPFGAPGCPICLIEGAEDWIKFAVQDAYEEFTKISN
jgi:hypothetical protein